MASSNPSVLTSVFRSYNKGTAQRVKLVDAYLLFLLLTGILQFVYCCIFGTFPFNAFLAGFGATVGSFVLGVSLRMQMNSKNLQELDTTPEKAFAEFVFCNVLLQFAVVNFIG
ncbi:briggsae CBR-DAD-1 protein [Piptocephalis cylindrospora]|uniref:Dolichyl-diphosphooligosaccharide--protein glycosyltransferase subunit OST2 n=1 Tax=Piptocephalis cylindrospora TaxID=1907219 RepID=A0A4P9Y7Q8_9FUNG|nr:briggsae CBR-DAD-1 protein [Piptocephalis cylindrospora]|eukprot:RKP13970.1 briggsae CBR-DAD-1 protein [Piptocephalis cylindrospora]